MIFPGSAYLLTAGFHIHSTGVYLLSAVPYVGVGLHHVAGIAV